SIIIRHHVMSSFFSRGPHALARICAKPCSRRRKEADSAKGPPPHVGGYGLLALQSRREISRLARIGLIGLGVFWMVAGRAATLLVTNLADSGPGTLRPALSDNTSLGAGNTISFSHT